MTTSPTPTPSSSSPEVAAWQSVLAAEHVAVFGYGVVAARLRADDDGDASRAVAGWETHQDRRDRATARLLTLGAEPVVADAAYALGEPVTDPASASRLAAALERGCAQGYADLVAAVVPEDRQLPARWLVAAAAAESWWSDTVPPLPGLDGRLG